MASAPLAASEQTMNPEKLTETITRLMNYFNRALGRLGTVERGLIEPIFEAALRPAKAVHEELLGPLANARRAVEQDRTEAAEKGKELDEKTADLVKGMEWLATETSRFKDMSRRRETSLDARERSMNQRDAGLHQRESHLHQLSENARNSQEKVDQQIMELKLLRETMGLRETRMEQREVRMDRIKIRMERRELELERRELRTEGREVVTAGRESQVIVKQARLDEREDEIDRKEGELVGIVEDSFSEGKRLLQKAFERFEQECGSFTPKRHSGVKRKPHQASLSEGEERNKRQSRTMSPADDEDEETRPSQASDDGLQVPVRTSSRNFQESLHGDFPPRMGDQRRNNPPSSIIDNTIPVADYSLMDDEAALSMDEEDEEPIGTENPHQQLTDTTGQPGPSGLPNRSLLSSRNLSPDLAEVFNLIALPPDWNDNDIDWLCKTLIFSEARKTIREKSKMSLDAVANEPRARDFDGLSCWSNKIQRRKGGPYSPSRVCSRCAKADSKCVVVEFVDGIVTKDGKWQSGRLEASSKGQVEIPVVDGKRWKMTSRPY